MRVLLCQLGNAAESSSVRLSAGQQVQLVKAVNFKINKYSSK